eukprot:SAG31_NODE_1849_length_7088_cov_2.647446_8_plen_98_part_00
MIGGCGDAEGNARNIAVFAGNVGHAGCAARLASFEGALNKHCGDRGHGMEYVLHAEFDRATAKALAVRFLRHGHCRASFRMHLHLFLDVVIPFSGID